MNCQEITELSSDYLDQRLAPAQVSLFEDHLKGCSGCRQEVGALRRAISLLGSLDVIETSPDFLGQVHRKIDRQEANKRIWAWLFEPIKIKVPLEVTALLLLGFLASHLYYRSPDLPKDYGFSVPSDKSRIAQDTTAEKATGKKDGGEVGFRTEQFQSRSGIEGEGAVSAPKSLEETREAKEKAVASSPPPGIEEVIADDVPAYGQKVQALLAEMGGRVLLQEGSPGSALLLTVELPQSRQAEFLSLLRAGAGAGSKVARLGSEAMGRLKKEAQERDELTASNRAAEKRAAAPVSESSLRIDEPMVKFQLRVLPKR